MSEKVTKAGDITINGVVIVTLSGFAQDVTAQVIGIDIFEDIFGSFITGKITLKDSQDLTNLFPLVGEETLYIDVITPTLEQKQSYVGEFYIFKMDDLTRMREREDVYTLHFVSKESILNMNKKISRGLSGKISDIAKNILSSSWGLETKKPINIEETKNKTKYVSNFWTPLENLVYIANTAVNMNDSPSYVFFENKYGLNFVSLESLYGVGIFQRFIWDNYSGEVDSLGGSRLSIDRDYQRILEIYPSVNFDYSKRLKSGMFGSELITYDMVTKQYVHTAYIPDVDKFNKLNEHPLWSKNRASAPISTLIYIPKYYNNFDGYDDVTNARTIQERQSFMTRSKASRISIVVNGRTDYSVGKKVYVEIPISSQITKEQTEWQNKILSGNYIISAIRHNITRSKHTCYLELAKDSYMVNLNDSK